MVLAAYLTVALVVGGVGGLHLLRNREDGPARRMFLEGLAKLHKQGKLAFFGSLSKLADPDAFATYLAPLRKINWVVYAKQPFGGPEAVLAYLSRYTHRIAISNHRLISADADVVAFKWKDYRIKSGYRMKVMRLHTSEFIRRFLIHVLPSGFHRIRHTGFLANGIRRDRIAKIRCLLDAEPEPTQMPDEATNSVGFCNGIQVGVVVRCTHAPNPVWH